MMVIDGSVHQQAWSCIHMYAYSIGARASCLYLIKRKVAFNSKNNPGRSLRTQKKGSRQVDLQLLRTSSVL